MTAQIVAGRKLIKKHMALISQSLKREIIYEGLQPHFSINSIIFLRSDISPDDRTKEQTSEKMCSNSGKSSQTSVLLQGFFMCQIEWFQCQYRPSATTNGR